MNVVDLDGINRDLSHESAVEGMGIPQTVVYCNRPRPRNRDKTISTLFCCFLVCAFCCLQGVDHASGQDALVPPDGFYYQPEGAKPGDDYDLMPIDFTKPPVYVTQHRDGKYYTMNYEPSSDPNVPGKQTDGSKIAAGENGSTDITTIDKDGTFTQFHKEKNGFTDTTVIKPDGTSTTESRNSTGVLTQKVIKNPDGSYTNYSYNGAGAPTGSENYNTSGQKVYQSYTDPKTGYVTIEKFTYADDKQTNPNGSHTTTTMKDKDGNLIVVAWADYKDGKLTESYQKDPDTGIATKTKYDPITKQTNSVIYNAKGEVIGARIMEGDKLMYSKDFDDKTKRTTIYQRNADGSGGLSVTTKDGKVVGYEKTDGNGDMLNSMYTSNEGAVTLGERQPDGKYAYNTRDKDGNLISQSIQDDKGTVWSKSWDRDGNVETIRRNSEGGMTDTIVHVNGEKTVRITNRSGELERTERTFSQDGARRTQLFNARGEFMGQASSVSTGGTQKLYIYDRRGHVIGNMYRTEKPDGSMTQTTRLADGSTLPPVQVPPDPNPLLKPDSVDPLVVLPDPQVGNNTTEIASNSATAPKASNTGKNPPGLSLTGPLATDNKKPGATNPVQQKPAKTDGSKVTTNKLPDGAVKTETVDPKGNISYEIKDKNGKLVEKGKSERDPHSKGGYTTLTTEKIDKDGKTTLSTTTKDKDGKPVTKIETTDKNGNKTTATSTQTSVIRGAGPSLTTTTTTKETRDKAGNLVNSNTIVETSVHTMTGVSKTTTVKDKDGKTVTVTVQTTDKNGRVVGTKTTTPVGHEAVQLKPKASDKYITPTKNQPKGPDGRVITEGTPREKDGKTLPSKKIGASDPAKKYKVDGSSTAEGKGKVIYSVTKGPDGKVVTTGEAPRDKNGKILPLKTLNDLSPSVGEKYSKKDGLTKTGQDKRVLGKYGVVGGVDYRTISGRRNPENRDKPGSVYSKPVKPDYPGGAVYKSAPTLAKPSISNTEPKIPAQLKADPGKASPRHQTHVVHPAKHDHVPVKITPEKIKFNQPVYTREKAKPVNQTIVPQIPKVSPSSRQSDSIVTKSRISNRSKAVNDSDDSGEPASSASRSGTAMSRQGTSPPPSNVSNTPRNSNAAPMLRR